VVTHQLQVERRTGKVRRPETDVLPLSHATNLLQWGERKEEMREKQWNEGGIGEKNGLEGKGGKCDFMQ